MTSNTCRTKPRSLMLGFFNANSLKDQKEQIHKFLNDHHIDILLVQETFLKPHMKNPNISNYKIIRHDRLSATLGGTLIYYRSGLHVCCVNTPELVSLEASVCRLAMTGHPDLYIASCYQPSGKVIKTEDLKSLLDMGNNVILAGDFNSKHKSFNCRVNNPNGYILFNFMDEYMFDVVAPMEPTHYPFNPEHQPDILDIALLKNISLSLNKLEVIHELDSDHRPVILGLGDANSLFSPTKTITNWDRLSQRLGSASPSDIANLPSQINSTVEIDTAINALSGHLQTVITDCTRRVPAMTPHRWRLPDDMKALLRAKHAATRAHDLFPSRENKDRLRSLHLKCKSRMKALRSERWDSLLDDIRPTHTAFWRLTRALKSDTVVDMPPLSKPDNSLAFDDDEKAECLALSLEAQCSPSEEHPDSTFIQVVDEEVGRRVSLPPVDSLDLVTVSEVKLVIKDLHCKKAPGSDGVSNRVLKNLSASLILLLVTIFNSAMANCYFPDLWKIADVIGIHKTGKARNLPSSYRPISLLISLGKVYERLLSDRLKKIAYAQGLIPNEQFGFRAQHSCVNQVHRITEYILDGFHRKRPKGTAALFFDIAKAFDKVWHNGLIFKLFTLGIPDRLVLILHSFLLHRYFQFRVEGSRSSLHPIRAGVPQGSVLAPLLFSLYTSDIPRHTHVSLALYADDTAIYLRDRFKGKVQHGHLQSATNALGEWFRKWRMEVNPEKSTAVYFSRALRRPNTAPQPNITLFGKPIPWSDHVKYLGVTFDSRLSFASHIRRVRNRASLYLGRLTPLFRSKKLSLRSKVRLYLTCIRPVMTYASVVFAHASNRYINSLQAIQNRFLRRATGAPWYVRNFNLHKDLQIPTIRQYLKVSSNRYFDQAVNHTNPLISQPANYHVFPEFKQRRRRPRHVLCDPDDEITVRIRELQTFDSPTPASATVPLNFYTPRPRPGGGTHTRTRPFAGPNRRARILLHQNRYYTRVRYIPGRFSPPPSGDGSLR